MCSWILIVHFSDTSTMVITQSTAITYFHCPKQDLNHRSQMTSIITGRSNKPSHHGWMTAQSKTLSVEIIVFRLYLLLLGFSCVPAHLQKCFKCYKIEVFTKIQAPQKILQFLFVVQCFENSEEIEFLLELIWRLVSGASWSSGLVRQ